jgi:signal transduction histidine kinase
MSRAIRIDTAVADVRRIEAIGGAALPRDMKTLQIDYTALELDAAHKLQFRYRLIGFDQDWIDVGTRRQAIYTNLPPRRYRFEVEARANGEQWSDAAAWAFVLPPMFYQTAWFYSVVMAALVLAIWGTWRVRVRVIQHEFSLVLAERTRLSREIHDTLLQSLVGLTLQINKLARVIPTSPSQAVGISNRMLEQVEMYIRDARMSIFDMRSPILKTHDLAAALDEFGHRVTADYGVAFQSHVAGTPRRLDSNVEGQVLRIGQEAITNAVRHAQARRIDLDVCFEEAGFTLRVRDDGHGFELESANAPSAHYGLVQMRERATEIGGRLTITTGQGEGTIVEIVVPMGNATHAKPDRNVA